MSKEHPVTPEVLAALSPDKAKQLKVWSKNHANLNDLRIHSLTTCPILGYAIGYERFKNNPPKLAQWLWQFFGAKHNEEKNPPWWAFWRKKCTCDKELAG